MNDTYLSLNSFVVLGLNGLPVSAIPPHEALRATLVGNDVVRPSIASFNLDLDIGTLTIVFDETVNISSFNISEITIQDDASFPTQGLQFQGGLYSLIPTVVLDISLTEAELDFLKTRKIPWKRLTKDPLVVTIDEVFVIVGPDMGKCYSGYIVLIFSPTKVNSQIRE